MRKNFLAIYTLLLCFVSAVCLTIASSIMVYDLVELNFPELTLPSRIYERHQSDELFFLSLGAGKSIPKKQIPKFRKESYRAALVSEQRGAKQSLLGGAITICVSSLLFWIHWRLSHRYRG